MLAGLVMWLSALAESFTKVCRAHYRSSLNPRVMSRCCLMKYCHQSELNGFLSCDDVMGQICLWLRLRSC